jgi:hypothetical protein
MAENMEDRIALICEFVQAKKCSEKDPDEMVSRCKSLLDEPHIEEAIRSGDVLAALVDFYHQNEDMHEAYKYLRVMEERRIAINPNVDSEILNDIKKEVGTISKGEKRRNSGVVEDSKQEDIPKWKQVMKRTSKLK